MKHLSFKHNDKLIFPSIKDELIDINICEVNSVLHIQIQGVYISNQNKMVNLNYKYELSKESITLDFANIKNINQVKINSLVNKKDVLLNGLNGKILDYHCLGELTMTNCNFTSITTHNCCWVSLNMVQTQFLISDILENLNLAYSFVRSLEVSYIKELYLYDSHICESWSLIDKFHCEIYDEEKFKLSDVTVSDVRFLVYPKAKIYIKKGNQIGLFDNFSFEDKVLEYLLLVNI